jgi:hypothetical protein
MPTRILITFPAEFKERGFFDDANNKHLAHGYIDNVQRYQFYQ